MKHISVEQRRIRLGVRHHLARPAADVVTVAGDLLGLHSSDAASVMLAARARVADLAPEQVEAALYEQRSLARVLGMRRTMFVVPSELVPVVHGACTRALAPRERRRTVKLIEDAGLTDDGERWLDEVEQETLAALEARGEAVATQLSEDVPRLKEQIRFGEGTKWAGSMGMSTRVLFLLATDGRIVRGRPRGSWISTQYRWAPMTSWVDVDVHGHPTDAARVELARRWLAAFGPATFDDLQWWTGWTKTQTRKALAEVEPVEVDVAGVPGLLLPGDQATPAEPDDWVALLPALDSTVMGYKDRDWYLGAHRPALFDRNGNAGPTVWVNGRVVGGWAQRDDGEIAVRFLEDVGSAAAAAVEAEAGRLGDWLGDVRFTPRFRTPLERELSA